MVRRGTVQVIRSTFKCAGGLALFLLAVALLPGVGLAQTQWPATATAPDPGPTPAGTEKVWPTEGIEVDISKRQVAVQSDFSGVQIVIFGSIENSRQKTADDKLYDIVLSVEGPGEPLVVRRKSRIAGIWVNAESLPYMEVPSYLAVVSSHPVDNVAEGQLRRWLGIGFDFLKLTPDEEIEKSTRTEFRDAIIRLKKKQLLYSEQSNGIEFIGSSLFRATVNLPANVSVGAFRVRAALFRKGAFIDRYETALSLEREGFERFVHDLAFDRPFLYGLAAVIIAIFAGFASTTIFRGK